MASKTKNIKTHFRIRCIERLGYIPEEKELIKLIQDNKLEFHSRQSNRVTLWKWQDKFKNIPCILVYDKERKQIITVLFERTQNDISSIT